MRSPWYRGPVKVTFAATDDVAVTKLQYSLDNGATWIDAPITAGPSVSSVVTITQEGNTSVRYRALDAAGNVSPGVDAGAGQHDAQRGLGRRRDLDPPGEHQRPRGRRQADDRHRRRSGDGDDRDRRDARTRPPRRRTSRSTAPLANAHASGVAVVAQAPTPAYRTVTVAIDTKAPVVAYPTLVDGPITASSMLTSTLTDPTPGSSGTGLNVPFYQQLWLDGKRVNAAPIKLSRASPTARTPCAPGSTTRRATPRTTRRRSRSRPRPTARAR